jgi:hypothetical protein
VYLRSLKLDYTESKKDETKFWSRNSEKENIYFFNNRNYDFITGVIYGTGNANLPDILFSINIFAYRYI